MRVKVRGEIVVTLYVEDGDPEVIIEAPERYGRRPKIARMAVDEITQRIVKTGEGGVLEYSVTVEGPKIKADGSRAAAYGAVTFTEGDLPEALGVFPLLSIHEMLGRG